jgi:hypothetical protein
VSGKPAEVEEVLETTEAFWAARSMVSSRVNRLTWFYLSISRYLGQIGSYHSFLFLLQLKMEIRSSERPWMSKRSRTSSHSCVVTRRTASCTTCYHRHICWGCQGRRGMIDSTLIRRKNIQRRRGRRNCRWSNLGRGSSRSCSRCETRG